MARTKKQTLVNACERRRQIQEEIRRETLAAKQKREGFSSAANVHSTHNGVSIANAQTVSRLEKMDNGTDVSSDNDVADHSQAVSTGSQETMSSLTHAASDASLFEGNLPEAIICIPDICRSPAKLAAEEATLQEQSSKGQGLWGKALSHSKSREESARKCSSSKHSEKNSEDVMASLRSLKAASEKVREEKSRKSRQALCALAQTSISGRRSPRQSSLLSSDAHCSASKKGLKDATSFSDEKPKVNIFTDNLGKDLGKRIRSPRRLSEDMIALPIFSARRWNNSPKDSSTSSYLGSIYDGMETLSLHTPKKSESFKSNLSPTKNKQSSVCESSKKSPSPGSSKLILLDEKGSTSTRNVTPPQEQHHHVQSDKSSPPTATTSVDFSHDKCPHLDLKTEPLCEDILQTFPVKDAKLAVLCSDEIKPSAQSGNIFSVFSNSTLDTSVVDDCDSLGGIRQSCTSSTSFPKKEDRSKHKTQEDADSEKSSTCKQLMSTEILIKCENRCLNDTVDAFVDVKTDISEDTELVCKVKTDVEEVKNIISVKIKGSSIQFGGDTEKETNRHKCPHLQTPALPVPLEIAEEKPQSSLLCAMLVGGTEVAHSYTQERVRAKSQGGDKSDSEIDIVKCESSQQASRSLPLQQSAGAADLRHKPGFQTANVDKIHKPGLQTVNVDKIRKRHKSGPQTVGVGKIHKSGSQIVGVDIHMVQKSGPQIVGDDHLNSQDSNILLADKKSDKMLPCDKITTCDKVTTLENTPAETSTCELVSVKIEDERDITDESKTVEKTEPVNFYKKLKQVNESVLKLIDIDVEEEFLQELEVDDSISGGIVENKPSDALANSEQCHSTLYNLISSLGTRLQCADSRTPFNTSVDLELVGQLMESCPKNAPNIMPRLKTVTRKELLKKRMNEENVKDIKKNGANEEELCVGEDKDEGDCEVDHQYSSTTTNNTYLCSETDNLQAITDNRNCVHKQVANNENVQEMDLDAGFSVAVCHLDNSSSHTATVSLAVNENIDQNANAKNKNSTVTSLVNLNAEVEDKSLQKCSEILQAKTDMIKVLPADISTRKVSETPTRLSFQKSKTCDDFNERLSANPTSHAGTLRRVNSSPQMNTKQILPPVSSSSQLNYATKDYTKSKLGSKIPVPGTSYFTKSKKSWRIPRTIVEPKPLSILSDLEKPSSQPTSAFTCPTLQKYLNVPSNRVIVTSDMQEEIKILDAQAKEQEEMNDKMMEDKDRSIDDDINPDFKNCEPDFDEVDGMLFMSFFSEIELRAHVIVEKALEWDKDDTMLRVSRAKAFEEAKTHKEDMGHYKLKHLRGQHMRWKKYRRMYSNEVKALMEAQHVEQPYDDVPVTKKTTDLSKIKGWKRKHTSMPEIGSDVNDNFNWSYDDKDTSFCKLKKEMKDCFSQAEYDDAIFDDSMYFMSENLTAEDEDVKPEMSSRSRRRQGFSHQKAHRQLFRELNMDWEDRMIHRKLGGWSLKGNRPQAFSSAAKKRKQKKSKEVESGDFEMKDVKFEAGTFEEIELDTIESKDHSEDHKKKRTIKMIYPLLTEKMARNALKTMIESGDIQRGVKRKKTKARQSSHQLPALIPVICKSEPEDETASIQLSDSASFVLSTATTLLTPSAAPSFTSLSSPSTSAATVPLEIDLQDEPVMEGVDIAAESISSPSVTDTSSMKSCGKPGCRYGCICHLCSVNESSAPLPSPLSKQPAPACDKEYCRLGCICDSIDPERPISSKTHCRRPSCMLQCICLETGCFDGNEDIPYLPSMRRRPKPGDRFSNLPQREKTHRSAKNLDAVTRKALMLYETSEIYCERVERSRKRPEMTNSPASTSFDGSFLSAAMPATCSTAAFDIDIVSDHCEDSSFQADIFSADIPVKSEVIGLTPSHPVIIFNTSPQHQHLTRNNTVRLSKPSFILDDVRQTVCVMEPSAHKRKRKSHPLSDEMFISSTCARTQPFKCLNTFKSMRVAVMNKDSEENVEISPSMSADLTCPIPSSTLLPLPSKPVHLKLTESDDDSKPMIPTISSVHTLAAEKGKDVQQWENTESETAVSHSLLTSPDSVSHQRMQNVTALKHASAQNNVSNTSSQGNLRQFHGWHKSMVCLKARAPPSSQDPGEDDVREEDEVKLLEFAANCNWEGAKREILAKVAQCLTRGQYPQPRTMNVCEFVVEILPKAHQPSHIPAELRAKLPGQMYSIRVRITRRESLSKKEDDGDIIDLSGSSPVKSGSGNDIIIDSSLKESLITSADQKPDRVILDSSLKESLITSADQKPGKATSDSSFLASNSVGISGLSKLFITSPPVSGQHQNSGSDNQSVHSSQTVGAHSFRRQSLESALVISSPDYKQATGQHTMTVQASSGNKPKGSSFLRFENSASPKTIGSAFGSESIKAYTTVSSSLKTATGNTTSKKLNVKPLSISQTNQPFVSKSVASGVTPIFGPFNAKDVKYMMSGKDGKMQLIEIAPTGDKKKKLIAVPITLSKTPVDLKGKQSAVVALPVTGMGKNRILPVLSPPTASCQSKTTAGQQIVLRLPSTQASSSVRHPVVLQPVPNSVKCHPPRFQVVPVQVSNCVTVTQAKVVSTTTTSLLSCTSTSATQKPVNSNDEMIMVFDAAHIKASHSAGSSVSCSVSGSTHDTEQGSESVDHCTTVTHSDDRLELTTDNTSHKQKDKNVTQVLTVVPLEEDVSVDKRTENVIVDCDDVVNSSSDHSLNKLDHADSEDRMESASQGDHGSALHTSDLNVLDTKTSLNGQLSEDQQLPEVSAEAEVSIDNTNDINSGPSVKEENLIEDALVKYSLSEIATTSRKNYSAIFFNSPVCVKEHIPRTLQEFAVTGSKRLISAVATLEEPLSPALKRPCLAVENPIILDEDSMASLNSVSGMQHYASSPLGSIDRPKSVMSGAMSTGSSEDMLILLSSEEDIDVGEDDRPDDIISYRVRVERALQNDHGSMYTKVDPASGAVQGNLKKAQSSDDIVRQNGLNHEDMDLSMVVSREQQQKYPGKDLQKVNHHNQLERLRRSRMKILFDELQQHVLKQKGLPGDHIMSKVKVLVEAKKVVLHLNKCVLEGSELVKLYERKNKSLQNKLAALKGNLMQHNVSAETISSVMQAASENVLLHSIKTEDIQPPEDTYDLLPFPEVTHPLKVDVDVHDSDDMVNLVSPSTDGDKVSESLDVTTPVYEDISDPEDPSTLT